VSRYSWSGTNGTTASSDAAATTAATSVARDASRREEPDAERPEEELQATRQAEGEPGDEWSVAIPPDERREEAEERREVGDADVAEDGRPERGDAVDPPVADADEPEGERHAAEPEDRERDAGRLARQRGERHRDDRCERRPECFRVGVVAVEKLLRLGVDLVAEVPRERTGRHRDDEHRQDDDCR